MSARSIKPRCRDCGTSVAYFGDRCYDCGGTGTDGDGLMDIVRADLAALNDRMVDTAVHEPGA